MAYFNFKGRCDVHKCTHIEAFKTSAAFGYRLMAYLQVAWVQVVNTIWRIFKTLWKSMKSSKFCILKSKLPYGIVPYVLIDQSHSVF